MDTFLPLSELHEMQLMALWKQVIASLMLDVYLLTVYACSKNTARSDLS